MWPKDCRKYIVLALWKPDFNMNFDYSYNLFAISKNIFFGSVELCFLRMLTS